METLSQIDTLYGCYMGGCIAIGGLFIIQETIYNQSMKPLRRFTGFKTFLNFPRLHPFNCRNYFTHFIPIE